MPKPREYLRGFNIKKDMTLGESETSKGFKLLEIEVEHITIKRYREYQYKIKMVWQRLDTKAKLDDLLYDIKELTSQERTIVTGYGNPYSCDFGSEAITYQKSNTSGIVTIKSVGHCYRV
jgi:hypothetical protein